MIVTKEGILIFIPHRPPFVMVDNLISASPERYESDFEILQDNILVQSGFFQESGLIENIAQTCAASFGFLDRTESGKVKMGFIGAISRLTLYGLPPVGSKINTIVTPTHQLGNIFMIEGRNYLDGLILLECEIKIVTT